MKFKLMIETAQEPCSGYYEYPLWYQGESGEVDGSAAVRADLVGSSMIDSIFPEEKKGGGGGLRWNFII